MKTDCLRLLRINAVVYGLAVFPFLWRIFCPLYFVVTFHSVSSLFVMKAKLKDVAALAGVAPNTASTILNRRSNSWASKETEQRVFDAAKTLGYTPSRAALALRLGRYQAIGLVIPDLHNPFYTTLASLLEQRLRSSGYDMVLEQVRGGRNASAATSILERQVDGAVYVDSDMRAYRAFVAKNPKLGRPAVSVTSRRPDVPEVDTVMVDFTRGFTDAIDQLYKLGHRRFVFLSALSQGQDGGDRPHLFESLLHARGVPQQDIHCIHCQPDWKNVHSAFRDFVRDNRGRLPTALVAINDLSAIAAMRAACEEGLRVPEDLSVVGVDNIEIGSYLTKQLSTIEQPLQQMADTAAELLLARLNPPQADGEETPVAVVRELGVRFIGRETTAPARAE